jgi:hypothetical protein
MDRCLIPHAVSYKLLTKLPPQMHISVYRFQSSLRRRLKTPFPRFPGRWRYTFNHRHPPSIPSFGIPLPFQSGLDHPVRNLSTNIPQHFASKTFMRQCSLSFPVQNFKTNKRAAFRKKSLSRNQETWVLSIAASALLQRQFCQMPPQYLSRILSSCRLLRQRLLQEFIRLRLYQHGILSPRRNEVR